MADYVTAILALALVGVVACRAVDDDRHPKVTLLRAEWSCRRSHAEIDGRPTPYPDGTVSRELSPTLVCDDWSRR